MLPLVGSPLRLVGLQGAFCYNYCMRKLKKSTRIFLFSTLAGLFFILLTLLLALPSHPECGTAGIDYMPCTYTDRLFWNLDGGSWILPFSLWALANILFLITTAKQKR